MACVQLVAVLRKFIFAHLQNILEKNSGSVDAFSISESAVQQDMKYIPHESDLRCQGAEEKFQFICPEWSPLIFMHSLLPSPLFLLLNILWAVSL